jgi:hypothetical protein
MNNIIEDEQDAEIMKSFENGSEPIGRGEEMAIKSLSSMDFYEALEQVILGEKIHKLEWGKLEFYGMLKDDLLLLHKPDGKFYQWTISKADIEGQDYVILK